MFPTAKSPLSTRLRRGIDIAVQFATLGEYGVEDAPQPARRRTPPAPAPAWRPDRTASQVGRATAAARRRGEPAKRVPTRAAVRSLAMRPPSGSAPVRTRKRAGQPAARPQPCIAP